MGENICRTNTNDVFVCQLGGETNLAKDLATNAKGWMVCKECHKKYQKAYREKNKERLRLMNKQYREVNKEKINKQRKTYRNENKEAVMAQRKRTWVKHGKKYSAQHYKWKKNKLKTDIQFRLRETIRARITSAIKSGAKSGSALKLLGCSIEEFKLHIEKQFKPGMTWDNWKLDGWHIDHIKPIKNFDLSDKKQLAEVCHYTNMRPLWAEDNLARRFEVLELEDKKPLG